MKALVQSFGSDSAAPVPAPPKKQSPPKKQFLISVILFLCTVLINTIIAKEKVAVQRKWTGTNVGKFGEAGCYTEKDGIFTVRGAGQSIWIGGDGFYFVHLPIEGDAKITARLVCFDRTQNSDKGWERIGLMIRETLLPFSKHALVFQSGGNGIQFLRRVEEDKNMLNGKADWKLSPSWLQLERSGNTFTARVSDDGIAWVKLGQETMAFSPYAYVGLAVCSMNPKKLNTAIFDHVAVEGTILPEDADLSALQVRSLPPEKVQDPRMEAMESMAKKLRAERATLVFPNKKKLIHCGHDMPTSALDVRNCIREMEKKPFDGLMIKLKDKQTVFSSFPMAEEKFLDDYENLAAIKWDTFTDNFIWINCTSPLDWFDEGQWKAVLHNAGIVGKLALFGRCAGICIDPETYGCNPWSYADAQHREEKTFENYEARVKQCGEEWVRVLQETCPRLRLLFLFFGNEYLVLETKSSVGRDRPLTAVPFSREKIRSKLPKLGYALLPAFINGILKGAAPTTTLINGNEGSYYYEKKADYNKFAEYSRSYCPKAFFDEDLREKYAAQVQVGSSVYVDFLFRLGWSKYLTAEERARWAEHNVYYAMQTTDEYVWQYGELINWWKGDLPPLYEDAVRAARDKIHRNQPLGFESESLFTNFFLRAQSQLPPIHIHRLKTPPVIDGNIDAAEWKDTVNTPPFQALWCAWEPLCTDTSSKIGYTDDALYIAFTCRSKSPFQKPKKEVRNDSYGILGIDNAQFLFGSGVLGMENVQTLITGSPQGDFPVYRFIVAAEGQTLEDRCNGMYLEDWDVRFNAKWKSAVRIDPDGKTWSAEMEIPWKAIGIDAPRPSMMIRINLARNYPLLSGRSSLSPTLEWFSNFLEPSRFARLVVE